MKNRLKGGSPWLTGQDTISRSRKVISRDSNVLWEWSRLPFHVRFLRHDYLLLVTENYPQLRVIGRKITQQVPVICQGQVSASNWHLGCRLCQWLDRLGESSSSGTRENQDRRLLGADSSLLDVQGSRGQRLLLTDRLGGVLKRLQESIGMLPRMNQQPEVVNIERWWNSQRRVLRRRRSRQREARGWAM